MPYPTSSLWYDSELIIDDTPNDSVQRPCSLLEGEFSYFSHLPGRLPAIDPELFLSLIVSELRVSKWFKWFHIASIINLVLIIGIPLSSCMSTVHVCTSSMIVQVLSSDISHK